MIRNKNNTVRKFRWLTAFFLAQLFLLLLSPEARSNVRPESITDHEIAFNLSVFDDFGIRNFSSDEKSGQNSFPPVIPLNQPKPQTGSEQCIIKESFRTYADRGNDPSLLAVARFIIGHTSMTKSLVPYQEFILISSKTGETNRVRPPPVL